MLFLWSLIKLYDQMCNCKSIDGKLNVKHENENMIWNVKMMFSKEQKEIKAKQQRKEIKHFISSNRIIFKDKSLTV